LGFVIQFLSHAAIVGFMAGAAVTIGLQQLKGLLNITNFTTKTDFISVMRSVWTNTDQVMTSSQTLESRGANQFFTIKNVCYISQS